MRKVKKEEVIHPRAVITDAMMNKTILTSIFMLTGCGLELGTWGDPCDPSNATNTGLSESQQSECDACGHIDCSSDTGETAGDGDPGDGDPSNDVMLACRSDADDWGIPWCWLKATTVDVSSVFPEDVHVGNCGSISSSYPHVGTFGTPVTDDYSGRASIWCGREYGGDWADADTSQWQLCTNGGGHASGWGGGNQTYYPATVAGEGADWNSQWPVTAGCAEYTDPSAGVCLQGLIAIGGSDPSRPDEWSCLCDDIEDDDDDCQVGAVCEAGYHIVDGFPTPTFCTWDESGHGGPEIYGLDGWADGISIDGFDVIVTPAFAVASFEGRAGLWNDTQSFDYDLDAGTATIKRCEADSLCTHLGFAKGVVIHGITHAALESLSTGEPIELQIENGKIQPWTLSVG